MSEQQPTHEVDAEIHAATEDMLETLAEADAGLDVRHTVTRFADVAEDFIEAHADDIRSYAAGRHSPEGVVGDYPGLWVSVELEGSVYEHVELLNSEHVDVHLLENKSGEYANGGRYSYTSLIIRPAVELTAGSA